MKIVEKRVEIEVLTGLRIGGEKETFEVGGLDNPVIRIVYVYVRDKEKKEKKVPIIPGSSIKGRMSSLLEKKYGIKYINNVPSPLKEKVENFDSLSDDAKRVHQLFRSMDGVKLIFSDLHPTEDTIEWWDNLEEKEWTYDIGTEIKVENVIDRSTGTTARGGLRKMERIVKGSRFEGIVTLVYENEKEEKENLKRDLDILEEGFKLISKTYLGGCGSRGYGRVKISFNGKVFAPESIPASEESNQSSSK